MAAANPDLFSPQEKAALLALQAAVQLRWSSSTAENRSAAVFKAVRVLHLQLTALSFLDDSPAAEEQRRRIKYDMVVALQTIGFFDSAVHLYKELTNTAPVPPYVLQAAGDAELSRKKPAAARPLLEKVVGLKPDNLQAQTSLIYSYIEDEDFEAAYELVDSQVQKIPQFRTFQGSKHQYPNPPALDAALRAALCRLYGDQLEEAYQRVISLNVSAPANSWLQQSTGDVALAREWPRQAEEKYQEALLLDRKNAGATAGLALTQLTFHEYGKAEALLQELKEQAPMEQATRMALRSFHWQKRPALWADFVISNAQGPEQDGGGLIASAELLSVPIDDRFRISAQGYYAWSELPEGHESLLRYGGGLEFQHRFWNGAAYLYNNESTVNEVGGLLRAEITPDDFWRFSVNGERFSLSTPLRALYYGITSDAVTASAFYRWSEQRRLAFHFSSAWFSDNNTRLNANAAFTQRLLDIPHFDLDALFTAYVSTNDRDDAPYFNPSSDFSIQSTLRGEHVLFRNYDNKITQRLEAGLGLYSQESYNEEWTGHLRYEQRYAMYPRLEGVIGLELGRNVYDGEPEPYQQVNFQLHVTF